MPSVSKVEGRGWIQEWYETGDPDLKARAKSLRARGYRVHSESMGSQVTQWGRLKMTLLDIRPGTSGDDYLEQVNPRRRRRANVGWKRTGLGKRSIRAFKKRSKKEGFRQEDITRTIKSTMRGRRNAGPQSLRKLKKTVRKMAAARDPSFDVPAWVRRMKQLRRRGKQNPPRVKGRRVKGGRAVTLRNFTGTIVRKSDGTVNILGRGRKR